MKHQIKKIWVVYKQISLRNSIQDLSVNHAAQPIQKRQLHRPGQTGLKHDGLY